MNPFYERIRGRVPDVVPPDPKDVEILTQPCCALSLREILLQFSNGDVTVRSHMPTNDYFDDRDDDAFEKDRSFDIPHVPDDNFEALEYVQSRKDDVIESQEDSSSESESPGDQVELSGSKSSVNPPGSPDSTSSLPNSTDTEGGDK